MANTRKSKYALILISVDVYAQANALIVRGLKDPTWLDVDGESFRVIEHKEVGDDGTGFVCEFIGECKNGSASVEAYIEKN